MQQWFEQELSFDSSLDPIAEKLHMAHNSKKENEMGLLKIFTVEAETKPGQQVCVSGNCSILGNWEINDAFVLTNTNSTVMKNK